MKKAKRVLWIKAEEEVLLKHYAGKGSTYCTKMLRSSGYWRTRVAVECKAKKMGLKHNRLVTADEMDFLCSNFRELGADKCAEMMGRPKISTKDIARRLGLTNKKNPRYTEDEKDFVRSHYPTKGARYCAEKLVRKRTAIVQLAFALGVAKIGGSGSRRSVLQ